MRQERLSFAPFCIPFFHRGSSCRTSQQHRSTTRRSFTSSAMSLAMHAVQSIKALRSPQLRTDKQSEVMIDPLAEQVGVGGVVAILMTAAVLKFLPNFLSAMKRNGNGTRSAG